HAAGDGRRGGGASAAVGQDDAGVVGAVCDLRRVPVRGRVVPVAGAGARVLERDGVHARAGVARRRRERDGAAQLRGRVDHHGGRRRVVDDDPRRDGGRGDVAGAVADGGPNVV